MNDRITVSHTRSNNNTYTKNRKKNICDMATKHPIKKPTARLLWNLRIIMVPPTDKASSMVPLQKAAKPSEGRRPITAKLNKNNKTDSPRIEYLTECVSEGKINSCE